VNVNIENYLNFNVIWPKGQFGHFTRVKEYGKYSKILKVNI